MPEFLLLDPATWFAGRGPSFLAALGALLATYLAIGISRGWLEGAMRRARVDTSTRILVRRLASASLAVFGTLTALGLLGVTPAAIVTLLGAVGLAFSLAMQDILKNFFSGIYLLLERPFRVGDEIRVKDQRGVVEHVGVRTTTLRTEDNVQVLVPNALVFAEVVSNHSGEVKRPAAQLEDGAEPAPAAGDPARPERGSEDAAVAATAAPPVAAPPPEAARR